MRTQRETEAEHARYDALLDEAQKLNARIAELTAARDALRVETYSVAEIRKAFRDHASNDSWGIPTLYEDGLLNALRGEYDEVTR